MFKNKSIAFRLTALILTGAVLILAVLVYVNYLVSSRIVMDNVENNAWNMANSVAGKVETILVKIKTSTENMALFAESGKYSLKYIKDYNRKIVERNREVFGAAIAFEPYSADSTQKYFSSYYYKDMGNIREGSLNDASYDYLKWDWYQKPKELNRPVWSEPYFDEGGGNILMTTYSYPFYRYDNGQKKFWGVVTHDLSLRWIKKLFTSIKIYETGYAFLLTKKGGIIAHPDTSLTLNNTIFDLAKKLNDTALYRIGEMMTAGESGFIPYYSNVSKKKAFLFFKPLETTGWSFGMLFPKEEIMADVHWLSRLEIGLGIAGACLLAVLILVTAKSISGALRRATDAAEAIAAGNIQTAEILSDEFLANKQYSPSKKGLKNESIRLFAAFRKMAGNLNSLIGQVQSAGIEVSSSAAEISASARQLEAAAAEQAASTREVTATTNQIAASSKELANTIRKVDASVTEAADMAGTGSRGLENLSDVMLRLTSASESISSKLSIINENANKISSVITTINKISDQTNLLSLNAAIEAEKAGDYGKGFAVVAREISRLSDQTAVAAGHIEEMVKEMQSSVSYGVMEMDKFSFEVRSGSEETESINSQLGEIIDIVTRLKPEFEYVEHKTAAQSEGAGQINESMLQLSEAAEQTKESLTEFKNVTSQLNEAVLSLKEEIAKFNLR